MTKIESGPFERRVVATADGSLSVYAPAFGEAYHSLNGALGESAHVFIRHGYDQLAACRERLAILEIGFGTGLNALLTWERRLRSAIAVDYTAIEAYPLPVDLALGLDYGRGLHRAGAEEAFTAMHRCPWNQPHRLDGRFTLLKRLVRLEDFEPPLDSCDIVYYDAFSPNVQPELWAAAIFERLRAGMRPGGLLVTYCAKGAVRRTLRAIGFIVEALPGPPGKREMTRARRP